MNQVKLGAIYISDNICKFTVWAPFAMMVDLQFVYPVEYTVSMDKGEDGYWSTTQNGIHPGFRYFYLINGTIQRPDPASSFQPEGVHGPSEVVDHGNFRWSDGGWKSGHLEKAVIYEIHTGTFTGEGTFDAVIPVLSELKDLGITAIELMPVAQFPGNRNWGYDGAYPYAVQDSYGGPEGLKRLSDACHNAGLALLLDVVYNHVGPEGNYLREFGPYFTQKYRSPWGEALNFDGEYNDGVRNFFLMNAVHWFENYHADGLRLDAVHGICDMSARHILEELADTVREYSEKRERPCCLVAESDLNDRRIVREKKSGGYGVNAQWSDDFHHSIHALITGETAGYYQDFGGMSHLKKALTEGFVYSGEYSSYRKRRHGNSSKDIPGNKIVAFIQNHDQVGNRVHGDRITARSGFEAHKLAAGTLMSSPYIPLIFMGEEYAEIAPFLYFISHSDPGLAEAVRNGRKHEFELLNHNNGIPDPQSTVTFENSRLDRNLASKEPHKSMMKYYKKLIEIRNNIPAIGTLTKKNLTVHTNDNEKILILHRKIKSSEIYALMNYDRNENFCIIGSGNETFTKLIDSADIHWMGPGSSTPAVLNKKTFVNLRPYNFVLYSVKENQ